MPWAPGRTDRSDASAAEDVRRWFSLSGCSSGRSSMVNEQDRAQREIFSALVSSPAHVVARQLPVLDNEAPMNVMLWTVAGAFALLITLVVAILVAGRDHGDSKPDLGSISGSWLIEHRATHDGKS